MKTGLYYGIVASTKTRVRCVFCGVYIPNANKCIEEHNNGAKHKEIMELVSENGISYLMTQGLYCKLCKTFIPNDESIVQHLQLDEHANWLAALDDLVEGEFINVEGFLASQTDDAYCDVCNFAIPCTLPTLEEHVNDEYHHDNVAESIKPMNAIYPGIEPNKLWCKICDLAFEDSISAVLEHVETNARHMDWFMRMEQFTEEEGIFIGQYLANQYENKAYCLKCCAEILCTTSSIEYHVQTQEHMDAQIPQNNEVSEISTSLFYYK